MFIRSNVRTMRYGTKTISFLGPKIWNLLPIKFKETGSLNKFKTKIPDWEIKVLGTYVEFTYRTCY